MIFSMDMYIDMVFLKNNEEEYILNSKNYV
jgi:hypothetical protein